MKKILKKILCMFLLIVCSTVIFACDNNEEKKTSEAGESKTPIFESFTIVNEYSSDTLSFKDVGQVTKVTLDNKTNPFGQGNKTIEQKINEEIQLGDQLDIDCVASANSYIYAITKIKNPTNQIISSITINGERYASNIFESKSTKKEIIVKIATGNETQIKNYTLEKIKYIDGNTAKDIVLEGDLEKSVVIGNYAAVSSQVSNVIVTETSIQFTVKSTDPSSLLTKSNGKLYAVVYDGNDIVKKELGVGTQTVKFDQLSANKKYQYAVVATYDKLDGNNKKNYIILQNVVTTIKPTTIEYTITKEAVINGVITVVEKAKSGDLISVIATANDGYELSELYYIEESSEIKHIINNGQFIMPNKNITVYATFEEIVQESGYTITVEKVGEGTFEIASSAEEGDPVDFTVTPSQGYKLYLMYYLKDGDDNPIYFGGDYLTMPANNITIYVYFDIAYTISVGNIVNGEISVDNLGIEDESISVDVTPNSGYKLKELYYVEEGSSTKHEIEEGFWGLEFDMPASNITIYATFEEIQSSETLNISSKQDLINFATNEEDWNKNISLTSNIDLEGAEWTPIGNDETPFEGVFNGNGYTISNFKITEELDYVGLFGYVEHGIINNLKVTNYTYTLDYSDSWREIYIGGLAASVNYGNIEKNYASGDISMLGGVNVYVGGLIGETVDTSVKNSYTNGNITGTLSGYIFMAGGLVGHMNKDDFFSEYSIQYCYSTTNVSITNIDEEPGYYQLSVGGLVGESDYNISNSYAVGNVSAVSNNFPSDSMYSICAGGLVAGTGAFAEISGYELDTQNVFATDSEYTTINDDATKYTLEQILDEIDSSLFGWDEEIWNLSSSSHPTLK